MCGYLPPAPALSLLLLRTHGPCPESVTPAQRGHPVNECLSGSAHPWGSCGSLGSWFEIPPPSGPAVLRGPGASPQPSVSSSLANGVRTVWFCCQSDSPKRVRSQCSDPDMPRLNVAYPSSGSCGTVVLRCGCFLSCPRAPGDIRTASQSCCACPSLWSAGLRPFSCWGEGGTCRPSSGPAAPICVIPEFQGWVEVGSRGRDPGMVLKEREL